MYHYSFMCYHSLRDYPCFIHSYRKFRIFDREIPTDISLPHYILNKPFSIPKNVPVTSDSEVFECRKAASVVRNIFAKLSAFIRAGISTQAVDDFVFYECMSNSVYPSPLGYNSFPKSVCTSVNQVVCHGIPSKSQILVHGDLISVDISVYNGHAHGDACRSYFIDDEFSNEDSFRVRQSEFLCRVAKQCCTAGIQTCGPHVPYTWIAKAICKKAIEHGCVVIPGICGHGIGSFFHGPPTILHSVYEQPENKSLTMKPGHLFTIEPCVAYKSEGFFTNANKLVILDDGWSVITKESRLTAQHEEMVFITHDGYEVLT